MKKIAKLDLAVKDVNEKRGLNAILPCAGCCSCCSCSCCCRKR